MLVELVTGETTFEATKNLFRCIDKEDINTEYFVVVPDRFTLQAENLLFDVLGIKASFNINVVSLTALAQKVLTETGGTVELKSPLQAVLDIKKIIEKNEAQLKVYKKDNPLFCFEILKNIMQIKSSLLKPFDLIYKGENKALKARVEDLSLIYSEYEKLNSQSTDSNDLLEKSAGQILKGTFLKESVLIFAGFDSFTEANYEMIKACMQATKKIMISAVKPSSIGNAYIFDNDIVKKIKKLAQECEIEIKVISPASKLDSNQLQIANNLFSSTIESQKSNFLEVFECSSIADEIDNIANIIKYKIYNGERYRDFAVCCSSLEEYQSLIEQVFSSRKIPYYTDSSIKLTNTVIVKFLNKIFDLKKKNFQCEDLLYIASSPLFVCEEKESLIALINERKINGKNGFLKYLKKYFLQINEIVEMFDKASKNGEFVNIVRLAISYLNEPFSRFLCILENEGLLKEKMIEEQAPGKLDEILNIIEKNNDKTNFKNFVALINLAISMQEISSLPSFCDAVFIGDSTASYFSEVNTLFVVGANAGALPVTMKDSGLITDKDIKRLNFKREIGPTVKMINRRNRFRLFCNLILAKKRLYISYNSVDREGKKSDKALFVTSLMKIFDKKQSINYSDFSNFSIEKDFEKFLFVLGGEAGFAETKMLEFLKDREVPREYLGSLQKVLKSNFENLVLNRDELEIKDIEKIYFPNKSFSVSQIERFYDCPFKFFVDYGLKLKLKETPVIEKFELGNFYHAFLERFVKDNCTKLKELTDQDIHKFVQENLYDLINLDKLEFAKDKELIFKELYRDSIKICKRVVKEAKNSNFVPKNLEFLIKESYEIAGRLLNLRGRIDRIDSYKNKFRIIDYKTGKISKNILNDLYFGKKLQLFVYSNALRKTEKLSPAGLYYFNAKPDYDNKDLYILEGITLNDGTILSVDKRACEENFQKSDLINLKKGKNGLIYNNASEEDFSRFERYALALSEKAVKNILDGKIKPLPTENSCLYCKYKGICLYNNEDGVRMLKENGEKYFKEGNNDEQ